MEGWFARCSSAAIRQPPLHGCRYSTSSSSFTLSNRKSVREHLAVLSQSVRNFQSVHCQIRHKSPNKKWTVLCYQNQESSLVEAGSMEHVYDDLANRLVSNMEKIQGHSKYIVGVAGPPGAGKSTLTSEVMRRVNSTWLSMASEKSSLAKPKEVACVLPMDGFHLYRAQLDVMEDPKEAHARRGAPWTFNPSLLLKCLLTLRNEGSVYAPSFDHGIGDPVEDDIFVSPEHKIVLVEGNYLFLEDDLWKDIRAIFDEKWFIDVDIDVAMQRVLKRHIVTAGKDPEEAEWRISYNDRPNAELIMKMKGMADLIIKSVNM